VSKELLAPLSASLRAPPPPLALAVEKEVLDAQKKEEVMEEKGEGWDRGRSGSVGTLDSQAQARVNGGGLGGLKVRLPSLSSLPYLETRKQKELMWTADLEQLTNPDPSSGRPSRDFTATSGSSRGAGSVRTSFRLSLETVRTMRWNTRGELGREKKVRGET
jgi:hypothetical protein